MRKLIPTLLIFIIIFGVFSGALAAEQIKINIDGQPYTPEQGFVNKNGTLLVPLRSFSEALYATVDWKAETKTVRISKDGNIVKFKLNARVATINEETLTLNEPAQLMNGSVYVPLRAAAEALEAEVSWDSINKVTTIESKEYVYLPQFIQQTMDGMLELESYDYTASVAVESGGISAKGEVYGTYQQEALLTMNLESAFFSSEAIIDEDTLYYRSGRDELFYTQRFDLPAISHPVESVNMFKDLPSNLKVMPHRDATSDSVYKEISFDIDKDKLLQFVAKNFSTEEEFEEELKELVEREPELKHIFETLNINVTLLLDDQNRLVDNQVVVSFETDGYGAGTMMEVKVTFNFSYSNFNQAEPITLPTEDEIYDPFDDMLYWNLDSVRDSVLTYHLVEGEYPTATGEADAMVDFTKLTAFQEEILASEDAYSELWAIYNEAYENGEIDNEFYIDVMYSVPTSSYYISEEIINLEAHKKAVMFYVDVDGEVGLKRQTEPGSGSGEFSEEIQYLIDLD